MDKNYTSNPIKYKDKTEVLRYAVLQDGACIACFDTYYAACRYGIINFGKKEFEVIKI